jgi:nitrous oxidase accessory protein
MKSMKKRIICILVCMLMISCTVISTSSKMTSNTLVQPLAKGSILYVGGSGLNNYTTIQDAIDNASDGDMVFVYDDASPYYENIVVEKSILLQGEDKETTIIDGSNISNGVDITANDVTVSGFTIQNCYNNEKFNMTSGILLLSTHNIIMDNILLQNLNGISNIRNYSLPLQTGFNTIINNQFINNNVGIFFNNESNNTISGNMISQCEIGIMLLGTQYTNISFNFISENGGGITIIYSSNTIIYRNNLSYNKGGVAAVNTNADQILQNNFIGNKKFSAVSSQQFFYKNLILKVIFNVPFHRNVWDENYWNGPRLLPHIIFGVFKLTFCIDWHPAQEPYDIPRVS